MKHCLGVRGFASGSHTVCVAGLQTQDLPCKNPAASRKTIANLAWQFEQQEGRSRLLYRRYGQTYVDDGICRVISDSGTQKLCEVKIDSPQETGKILE